MDGQLALGIVIGLVTGIVGNLLTPDRRALWRALGNAWRYSQHGQIRQQITVLQKNLDDVNRRREESDRDLLLYLARWFLAIFAVFSLSAALALFAMTALEVTPLARRILLGGSNGCLILTLVMTAVLLIDCRYMTAAGSARRKQRLEASIAKLKASLPPASQ